MGSISFCKLQICSQKQIFLLKSNMKINNKYSEFTFVTCQHGNEPIPLRALQELNIPQIIANPLALGCQKRFIDHDLNASFGLKGIGFEFSRAKKLLREIPKNKYVIDFHTYSTKSDPFAIVVDEDMIEIAIRSGVKHIVIMRHNIKKGHALINFRKGVSIEVGKHDEPSAYEITKKVIKNLFSKKNQNKPKIYEVYDVITKQGNYDNFKEHPDGFIPVLAGEKAYKDSYFGLKAREFAYATR